MAYFRCSTGSASSGDGVALVVQCDANFAGSVITATNGTDTFTETCPSASPYTVRFEGIPTGTYTISGVSQGQTFTTQFTVLDYETTLSATPEGATVLPINDVQIWLHCANIFDKNYTTISEVLADNTSLITLISSNNAVDYMVRSTDFATDVCANQTAMGYIGNNDYAADTLLADATWCEAICNSTYFESVLNVKVPTMTSDTTPSGECISSGNYASSYPNYYAFDGNTSDYWASANGSKVGAWIGYKFTSKVGVRKVSLNSNKGSETYTVQGSDDQFASDINDLGTITSIQRAFSNLAIVNNNEYQYYRLICTATTQPTNLGIHELQFYGRA